MNSNKTILISVEGNIGVGKSTFISLLKNKMENKEQVSTIFEFLYEPVEEWLEIKDKEGINLLETFYKDKSRWSYTFQNIAYITRLNRLIKALNINENKGNPIWGAEVIQSRKIIIQDRSLNADENTFTKMLYEDGYINELEMKAYKKWNYFYEEQYKDNIKHYYIYLRCDPKIAYERINKRSREEENKIEYEYLEKLHNYHDKWLLYNQNNCIILDCDEDFLENKENFERMYKKIFDWIK